IRDPFGTELPDVIAAIGNLKHPAIQPLRESFGGAALRMIVAEKVVIAPVISLHGRGVSAKRLVNDGCNGETGDESAIRIGGNNMRSDDFLRDDDDAFRGAGAVNGDAEISPEMRVALLVSALDVDDGDVRTQSVDGNEVFVAYRRLEFAEAVVVL